MDARLSVLEALSDVIEGTVENPVEPPPLPACS